jgi:hypothetical protein
MAGLCPRILLCFRSGFWCQASSVAGVTGKIPAQRRRGMNHVSGEPGRVSWLVPDPASLAAQHCVLASEHENLGVLGLVPAEYQDSDAE